MAADRPEKRIVRDLWVEEVRRVDEAPDPGGVPLYLTMPGSRGTDISLLVDEGILELEENEALKAPEEMRLVAIESSPIANVELRKLYPGIKVLEADLPGLLRSESLMNWPDRSQRPFFRARVVNLDLNDPLKASVKDNQLWFPVLALVYKLAMLHTDPAVDWTLCLTLHGEVIWEDGSAKKACEFMLANFERDPEFAEQARATLGADLFAAISGDSNGDCLYNLDPTDQQRILMVIVPKRIAFDTHRLGFCLDTVENLRYGGSGTRAPMVTWILRFAWDERASTDADSIYGEALPRILARRGYITARGLLRRGS
jgi:hypothetical protein